MTPVIARTASIAAVVACTLLGSSTFGCAGDIDGDGQVGPADLAGLLANWGLPTGDVDGDGIVGGSDIGALLASWGPCAPACDGYTNMEYPGTLVGGAGSSLPPVLIIGTVNLLPTGEPQGALTVYTGGTSVSATMALGATSFSFDGGLVYLPSSGPLEVVLVDGVSYSMADLFDGFAADLASGMEVNMWWIGSRAALVLAALVETQPFCCNLEEALLQATEESFAFWSKVGTASLGSAVMAEASDGCGDFDNCLGDGFAPIGKFNMPCESVDPLCTAGDFAGGQATFAAMYGLWIGQ